MSQSKTRHMNLTWACIILVPVINVWTAHAATRCYDNLGCYESLTLHALPQEPSHVRTEYRLSCRGRIDDVVFKATDSDTVLKDKIEQSCLVVDHPIRMIIHGFRDSASASWVERMRDAFLAKDDCNVIAVDWHHGAPFPYVQAVANSFLVARQVAHLVRHLELVHGVPPLTFYLIGHSIGGHIAGLVGEEVVPSRLARITGLDPAEPYFDTFNDSLRLDSSDAIFVDVIHTDGESFAGYKGYGSMRSQGHVDFYPNGGKHQPGCGSTSFTSAIAQGISSDEGIGCSHHRAIELYVQSIGTNPSNASANRSIGSCSLWGVPNCPSWDVFEAGNCSSCAESGGCAPLGFSANSMPAPGEFYLSTSAEYPFCGKDYIVTVYLSPDQKRAFGHLELILHLNDTSLSHRTIDFSRTDHFFHAQDNERHIVTTNVSLHDVTTVEVQFTKSSGIPAIGTADILALHRVEFEDTFASGERWLFCAVNQDQTLRSQKGNNQVLQRCNLL